MGASKRGVLALGVVAAALGLAACGPFSTPTPGSSPSNPVVVSPVTNDYVMIPGAINFGSVLQNTPNVQWTVLVVGTGSTVGHSAAYNPPIGSPFSVDAATETCSSTLTAAGCQFTVRVDTSVSPGMYSDRVTLVDLSTGASNNVAFSIQIT